MIRRPPRSTRTHSFPTRRSSDLPGSGMAGHNAEDGSVLGAGAGWVLSCLYLRCLFFRAQWLGTASKWRRPRGVFPPSIMHASPHIRRSEEHTSELQSLMRISYAVFCLKKKKKNITKEIVK